MSKDFIAGVGAGMAVMGLVLIVVVGNNKLLAKQVFGMSSTTLNQEGQELILKGYIKGRFTESEVAEIKRENAERKKNGQPAMLLPMPTDTDVFKLSCRVLNNGPDDSPYPQ